MLWISRRRLARRRHGRDDCRCRGRVLAMALSRLVTLMLWRDRLRRQQLWKMPLRIVHELLCPFQNSLR